MTNLPNNQIILDQSERGSYPLEDLETWETGAHIWHSLQKDNPSFFQAIPHKDGKYSTEEYQANGHFHNIVNSSKVTQQDSRTDGTTNNKQSQVGGGNRTVNGQGEHRERGGDDTKAVQGSTIAISKDTHTHISNEHGHHAVKGDYGFYVKGGGYSVASEQQMVITTQDTMHVEAQEELSLKGIKNFGATTKGKMTFDSKGSMLANTADTFTANSAGDMKLQTQSNMEQQIAQNLSVNAGQDINIVSGSSITLTVGGSFVKIEGGQITLKSGIVLVNNQQVTPTSNMFT